MAIGSKEFLGKPISEKLSDYLRAYSDKFDRADVSTKTGIGTSTIRDVAYRTNSLTKENSKAITELMKIAVRNCGKNIVKSTKAKEELKAMLK